MRYSPFFLRFAFVLFSIVLTTFLRVTLAETITLATYLSGIFYGTLVGITLFGCDFYLKKLTFRSFNTTIVGLFFGYLMGLSLILIFSKLIYLTFFQLNPNILIFLNLFLFLFSVYLGITLSYRYSQELHLILPFVKLQPLAKHVRELLLDLSAMSDARIIDLAATGLLNQRLMIPRFLLTQLNIESKKGDESLQQQAKRSLDILSKLESMSALQISYKEGDFPAIKDPFEKVIHLARLIEGDLLTADITKIQVSEIEGIKIINLHTLAKALKPIMHGGEFLKIKMQRIGKEERQGIGYLEDGTMVVVNGGGDFLGDTIDARVLSVKHTQSGRMVFCNLMRDN